MPSELASIREHRRQHRDRLPSLTPLTNPHSWLAWVKSPSGAPVPARSSPSPSRTTTAGRPTSLDKTLAVHVHRCEIHAARLLVQEDADPCIETASRTVNDGTRFDRLTAVSLAVLVDGEHDGLLMLPLMLNLGVDIQQIDSQGRTLLHFARTRRVARYLIEHGVPVAPGMREAVLDAFTRPQGEVTFGAGMALGIRDCKGVEPWIFRAVRKRTARHWGLVEGPSIPRRHWRRALDSERLNAMIGAGFNEPEHTRRERDALYVHGLWGMAPRPPLIAEMSANRVLHDAVDESSHRRVILLLRLGAMATMSERKTVMLPGRRMRMWVAGTPLACAVARACENIEYEAAKTPKERRAAEVADGDLPAVARVLSAFAGSPGMGGAHTAGGCTLMHLAVVPEVARWLINQGAPVDVPDNQGRLPEEVVPPGSAAVILEARLQQALPKAKAVGRQRRL